MPAAKAPSPIPFVREVVSRLAPPGGTVVDVGCGVSPYRSAVQATYIGVDVTDEPYRDGVPRDVDLVAPAHDMPLAHESVDLLFTVAAFLYTGDAMTVLSEFRRVLRPGGNLLIVDYNGRARRRLAKREHLTYPTWSQWRLAREVRHAGFQRVRLLAPVAYEARGFERLRKLVYEELRGQWAVVHGRR